VDLPAIKAIFWDVGGVLLTDAWDHTQRADALAHFGLDQTEFQQRHEMLVSSFERGKIGLDEYLDRTVFYRGRSFTRESLRDYMFSLSKPKADVLALAQQLAKSGKYFMSTINNESLELNLYRIQTYGLRDIFSLFVSSCFVGLRKPEDGIYRLALELTQRAAEECCFLDDRPLNLEAAVRLGIHAIAVQDGAQVSAELGKLGVSV
jgi:putative hydrolase of the HAD superfamily